MFERFTERARRTIFFARYEASQFGSEWIEPIHLLLGLLREDKLLRARLSAEAVRREIERRVTRRDTISTSVDLPISQDVKQVLSYAAEEAEALNHRVIHPGHLVLGLLRLDTSLAAELLQQNGIRYEGFRELVGRIPASSYPEEGPLPADLPPDKPAGRLKDLLDRSAERLQQIRAAQAGKSLAQKPWSKKEALGHLIDWAATHHQWFARALTGPKLVAAGYPEDDWVAVCHYRDFPWDQLVSLWLSLNDLLIHVLARVPEEKWNTPCRIGVGEPVPLSQLAGAYIAHAEEILGQILTRD